MLFLKKCPFAALICLALVQLVTTDPQPKRVLKILPIGEQQFGYLPEGRDQETSGATATKLKNSISSTWQTLLNRTGLLAYRLKPPNQLPNKSPVPSSSISQGYPLCVIKTGAGEGRAEKQNHDNERPIVNCVVVAAVSGKPIEDIDYGTSEQDVDENADEDSPSTDEPLRTEEPQVNVEVSSVASEGVQEESDGTNQAEKPSSEADSSSSVQKSDGEEESVILARLPAPYYPQPYPLYGLRSGYGGSQSYPDYPSYSTYSASPSSSTKRDNVPFFGLGNSPLPLFPPFNNGYSFPPAYPFPPSGYPGGYPSFNPYQFVGPIGFPPYFGPPLPPPLPLQNPPPPGFPLNLPYASKFSQSLLLPRTISPVTTVGVKGVFNGRVHSEKAQEGGEEAYSNEQTE